MGDTLDTISYFDLLSQRRTDPLPRIDIPPAAEILYDTPEALADAIDELAASLKGKGRGGAEGDAPRRQRAPRGGSSPASLDKYIPLIFEWPATLFDYTPDALVFVSELARVKERMRAFQWQLQEDIKTLLEEGQLCRGLTEYALDADGLVYELQKKGCILLDAFAHSGQGIPLRGLYNITARQLPVWSGGLDLLTDDLTDMLHRDMACLVLAGPEEKTARTLAEDLAARGIPALYAPSPEAPIKKRVLVLRGGLSSGADFPEAGFAVIIPRRGFPRSGGNPAGQTGQKRRNPQPVRTHPRRLLSYMRRMASASTRGCTSLRYKGSSRTTLSSNTTRETPSMSRSPSLTW